MILYEFVILILSNICIILSNICIILCKVHMMSNALQSSSVVSKKIILFVLFCNMKLYF